MPFSGNSRHVAYLGALAGALVLVGMARGGRPALAAGAVVTCGNAPFVLRNARVFDGDSLRPGLDVFVTGDTIAAVGRALMVPVGTPECTAPGRTLLPGLIDAHAHVQDSLSLREALLFGVTTELDMFSELDTVMQPLRLTGLADRSRTMADLRSAGVLVTAPGGHGTEYGYDIPVLDSRADKRSALRFVDSLIRQGSDYIKIVYDAGAEWGVHRPTLSRATMAATVAAAHDRHKLSIVHIGTFVDARAAVDAGVDILGHFFADSTPDPHFGEFVAAHGVSIMTTLSPLVRLSGNVHSANPVLDDATMKRLMDSTQISELEASFAVPLEAKLPVLTDLAAQLRAAHVRILAGTDAPNPGTAHGVALHLELGYIVQAGFTPTEALRAATSAPADVFHLSDRGHIRPGARADLLMVVGDPTQKIAATMAIDGIWKRGVAVTRMTLPLAQLNFGPTAKVRFEPATARTGVAPFPEWRAADDHALGGHSTASITLAPGGAARSHSALRVTGMLEPGAASPAAGVAFRPRRRLMSPPPFLGHAGFDVWVKGDTAPAQVVFRLAGGASVARPLRITRHWQQVHFTFADAGVDRARMIGIDFLAGPTSRPTPFSFEIDEFVLR